MHIEIVRVLGGRLLNAKAPFDPAEALDLAVGKLRPYVWAVIGRVGLGAN